MSKRKHNVSYVKPNEPKFLRELKDQIGYKEGPTIDTKREALSIEDEGNNEDHDEEKPVVVVLNTGDLTAEEAYTFNKRKEEEEANVPADLTKRIIFRKNKLGADSSTETCQTVKKKIKKNKQTRNVLSFTDNEEDEF